MIVLLRALLLISGLGLLCVLPGCHDSSGDEHDSLADTPTGPVREIAPTVAADPQFLAENRRWQAQRRSEVLAPRGLASLVSVHWLTRDTHFVGSHSSNGLRLEIGPEKMGLITRRHGEIWFTPEAGAAIQIDDQPVNGRVVMRSEAEEEPTVIQFDEGDGAVSLIRDGQQVGLWVTHAGQHGAMRFGGLNYWTPNPNWRMTAAFLPHERNKTISVSDINGRPVRLSNPGTVEFTHNGQPQRLEVLATAEKPYFILFFDLTISGAPVAGRYLDLDVTESSGRVLLDFNRAHNPPCAFSQYIPCLVPPTENYLNFAVEAGEKIYHPLKFEEIQAKLEERQAASPPVDDSTLATPSQEPSASGMLY